MKVIEISCLEVWREISNYIEDGVDAELRARMEAHFKVCAHCTAFLDGTRNVVKLVTDGVEYPMPDASVSACTIRLKTNSKLQAWSAA